MLCQFFFFKPSEQTHLIDSLELLASPMGSLAVLSTNPYKSPLSTRHQAVSTVCGSKEFQNHSPANSSHEEMQTSCQTKGKKAHGKIC